MVELLVDGKEYSGWKEVEITRSMESAAGAFALSVSERRPWSIIPNRRAEVRDRGVPLAVGWIDKASSSFAATSHNRKVIGRDLTADMVDCSAMNEEVEWTGLDLYELSTRLADPFGLDVVQDTFVGDPFEVFRLQPGETAWEALERACRMRGLLAHADRFGALRLAKPGSKRSLVSLVEGQNILEASIEVDRSARFSNYTVRGQSQGSNNWNGELAAQPEGTAVDLAVERYRPLMVLGESNVTPTVAQDRAQWEAAVRAARGSKLVLKVQGWHQASTPSPWDVNMVAPCVIPYFGLDDELLITSLTHSQGASGTFTKLELMRPDAFLPQPAVPPTDPMEQWGA